MACTTIYAHPLQKSQQYICQIPRSQLPSSSRTLYKASHLQLRGKASESCTLQSHSITYIGQFNDNQSINQRMNSHQFSQANNQKGQLIDYLLGTLEKPCLAAG
jgi:hypothetical protein